MGLHGVGHNWSHLAGTHCVQAHGGLETQDWRDSLSCFTHEACVLMQWHAYELMNNPFCCGQRNRKRPPSGEEAQDRWEPHKLRWGALFKQEATPQVRTDNEMPGCDKGLCFPSSSAISSLHSHFPTVRLQKSTGWTKSSLVAQQ